MELKKIKGIANVALFCTMSVPFAIASASDILRIHEECFIASCPGHTIPTSRDTAARVKLTAKQCKVEQSCESVLMAIRAMEANPTDCTREVALGMQEKINKVEKQISDLGKKTKADVFSDDGRPTIGHVLEIELEKRLSKCEAAGLFPRWEASCITTNCNSYLSYIDGLAVDKATCEANDGGVQLITLKSENYLVGQKLEEYLDKCRQANLLPATFSKKKPVYYAELDKRKNAYEEKLMKLATQYSAGFGKNKVILPVESFNGLITTVDNLQVDANQCNPRYGKVLKKAVTAYEKLFKKYPEFSQSKRPQAERALEKIGFHEEACKNIVS